MNETRQATLEVKAGHMTLAGSAMMAAVLMLSGVDVVEFALYMGITTLVLAMASDVYQRLGRFNFLSSRRK